MPLYSEALGLVPAPAVGLHENVPDPTYRTWDAISQSLLQVARVGQPIHVRAVLDGLQEPERDSRRFGTATHCRLLEPERFAAEYQIAERCGAVLKSGANKGTRCRNQGTALLPFDVVLDGEFGAWRCGTHADDGAAVPDKFVTAEEAADIETLRAALMSHDVVRLFRQHGGHEVSAVWRHNGYDYRGRFDKLIHSGTAPLTVIDLKKTLRYGATEAKFAKSLVEYGYAMQAAAYTEAIEQLLSETPVFIFVVIEDKPPHDVGVWQLDDDSLECGRAMLQQAREVLYRCLESGQWPGSAWIESQQANGIRRISVPAWAKRDLLATRQF